MPEISIRRFFNTFHVVSFLLVSSIIVIVVNMQQRHQAIMEAEVKTHMLLEYNLAIHTYFAKQLKPRVFEISDKINDSNYFEPTWMSSTYAVREIDKYYRVISKNSHYYKESAINARSPQNEADDYEKSVIDEMKQDTSIIEKSLVRSIDGKPYYVVIRRGESMEQSCLRCHSTPETAPKGLVKSYGPQRSFKRNEGELVSAISIRIPLAEAYSSANNFSIKLSLYLILIMYILFFIQYAAMYRLILKPFTNMSSQFQAIIADGSRLGEEIPITAYSKETNNLIRLFNLMSCNLKKGRSALEKQVEIRTGELREKVSELETALAQIKKLEGIIPICSYCKKISDDEKSWHQLEKYISEHSDAVFSHAICPECFKKVIDDIQ